MRRHRNERGDLKVPKQHSFVLLIKDWTEVNALGSEEVKAIGSVIC
jgi:hypothetical protein